MSSRRRYLRIQAELGGNEVILSARARISGSAPSPPAEAREGPSVEDGPPEAEGTRAAALGDRGALSADRSTWPPVPGPGLTIVPAGAMLPEAEYPSLATVAQATAACRQCGLCSGRMQVVPGEGNPTAGLMCVGEGPGETEDRTGRPFVGRAGELLTGILAAIGLSREDVFIANVVKCRPPQNRKPLPDEMAACLPFLRRQIALVRPKVLLALGATAAEGLLGVRKSLTELRGHVHRYDGTPLIVTYHPAALLRNPNWKKPTWDDVRIARQLLDA